MAIKIKKKDQSPEPDETDAAEAPMGKAKVSPDADAFTRASWETATWVEENRQLVIAGVVILVVAIFGGYLGLQYLEAQKVEASSSLTGAFDAYSKMVEGSAELESIRSNPDFDVPGETFESEDAKWQAMYDAAATALSKHPNTDVAQAARLSKAAAALRLEKHDEAISLYEAYRKGDSDPVMEVAVLAGLATAYAAAEKWEDAIATLDLLAEKDEDYALAARYQKARILERAGDREKAKDLYHEILDAAPDHPEKTDIERRLANM